MITYLTAERFIICEIFHVLIAVTVIGIPRGWYLAVIPGYSGKYEKITPKNTKSPTPGCPLKIRKNYRKNTKWQFLGHFLSFFSVIFSYFRDSAWGGGFSIFCRNFFVFLGIQGFLGSVPPPRDRQLCAQDKFQPNSYQTT